jgi:uncharacterized damage-inducible protein DinB
VNYPLSDQSRFATRVVAVVAIASLCASSRSANAQDVMDQKSVIEVRTQYLADLDTLHSKFVALAKAIPDSSYGWRPRAGVRSVSEVLMHVVGEWYFFTPMAVGGKPPADFGAPRETLPKLEKTTKKSEVLEQLDKSWAHCKQQIQSADLASLGKSMTLFGRQRTFPQLAFGMTADLHEHMGQLIAYARSVDVVPPWSK